MASGFPNTLPSPSVAVVPRVEPYLVEVVIPFPLGSGDEAVALAAAKIAELLARPDLGEALAETPDAEEDSPRVATAAMVQAVKRLVLQEARTIAAEIAREAIVDLLTSPGKLSELLPREMPAEPETPWLNGDLVTITPGT